MSKGSLIFSIVVTAAIFGFGCFAAIQGNDGLFFSCSVGAIVAAVIIKFGSFMQGLKSPAPNVGSGHQHGIREQLRELADANPEHPGLTRLYAWLLALIAIAVILRLLGLFGK